MLENSKDLLYIVISFCVLWLTAFLCWMIYYIAMLLKQGYDVAKSIRQKVEKVEGLIDLAKSKLEKSTSHLALVSEGVAQLVKYLINKKQEAKTKNKKK
ncbi:MAG: hypothetical protein WC310_00925 [Patescibacteria group bacterium]|jgi:ABC-type transport system involved in cytochrome bd biosynthesis fused ATPase/permease subunit